MGDDVRLLRVVARLTSLPRATIRANPEMKKSILSKFDALKRGGGFARGRG